MRAFAIISVLADHTLCNAYIFGVTILGVSLIYLETLFHIGVPLFLFISGFVLFNKYKYDINLINFYKKRFLTIIIPYLIFSLVYIVVFRISEIKNVGSAISFLINFNSNDILWYIALVLQMYLFYPLICYFYSYIRKLSISNFIVSVASLTVVYIYSFTTYNLNLYWFFGNLGFIYYVGFFLLGIYFNDHSEEIQIYVKNVKSYLPIICVILIFILTAIASIPYLNASLGTNIYPDVPEFGSIHKFSEFIALTLTILFIYYILNRYDLKSEYLEKIGNHSFGIYFLHILIIPINFLLFGFLNITREKIMFYPIYFILMLGLSYLISYILCNVEIFNNSTKIFRSILSVK